MKPVAAATAKQKHKSSVGACTLFLFLPAVVNSSGADFWRQAVVNSCGLIFGGMLLLTAAVEFKPDVSLQTLLLTAAARV